MDETCTNKNKRSGAVIALVSKVSFKIKWSKMRGLNNKILTCDNIKSFIDSLKKKE